jgi:hypothetical protein
MSDKVGAYKKGISSINNLIEHFKSVKICEGKYNTLDNIIVFCEISF